MQQLIACLLLGALFGVTLPMVSAQEEQSPQHLAREIETLKQRVADLEKKLQTVENVEKLELARNYTDAQAKLVNAEFGRFERELRGSNNEWLREWSYWFLGVIGIFVVILAGVSAVFAYWLRSRTDKLIAGEVEMSLTGFKETVGQVDILKNQLGVLEKEHTAATLEEVFKSGYVMQGKAPREEVLKELRDDALLDVFGDNKYYLPLKHRAAEVLATRRCPRLVPRLLEFLNSVVDSDLGIDDHAAYEYLRPFSFLLGQIPTLEAHEGVTRFLSRLLKDNPRHRNLFLNGTAFSLTDIGLQLERGSSVTILRKAIPELNLQGERDGPMMIARYFERYNEPDGIKEILTNHGTSLSYGVEEKCLELLKKHDSEFVEEWRARKAADEAEA